VQGKRQARAIHVERTVEAVGVPAGTRRRLLRAVIVAHLRPGALEAAKAADSEREHLHEHLQRWADLMHGEAR
jgi:hypothetical protein